MIANNLLKMLILFFLSGLVAAAPSFELGDSSAAQCQTGCQLDFTSCLDRHHVADFCRGLVCNSYDYNVSLLPLLQLNNKSTLRVQWLIDAQCQACQACGPAVPTSYEFAALVDVAGEGSTKIVSREPQSDPSKQQCIIVCQHASCQRRCSSEVPEVSKDINDALIIDEEGLQNGTVSIKIENLDEQSQEPRCIHWVCVFRNCSYVPCKDKASTEAVAYLATLKMLAEQGNDQNSPEGCREVCKDSPDGAMCIKLCAPSDVGKRSVSLVTRGRCQRHCMGKTCWTVCYPPYGADSDVDEQAVRVSSDACKKLCDETDRDRCIMICPPPDLHADEVEKRNVDLAPRGQCQRHCLGTTCWAVCYPPFRV